MSLYPVFANAAKRFLPKVLQRKIKRILDIRRDRKRAASVRALVDVDAWESPPCVLCGGHSVLPHTIYNGFTIVRCIHDGLIFASPRPQDVSPFYDERYYNGNMICGYNDYHSHATSTLAEWAGRLDEIRGVLGRTGALCDVGSATGLFLNLARSEGWTVSGVEMSAWAVEQCRVQYGIEVFQGTLPDGRIPTGAYDVVTLYDCIEHLQRPDLVLKDVGRILKRDGILQLSTGALPHLDQHLVSRWYYPPWHLYYFSDISIQALLRKCGFEVVTYRETGSDPAETLMIVVARPSGS